MMNNDPRSLHGTGPTSSVVSNLDPADGVRAPDPVIVSHHQLEADPLRTQVRIRNIMREMEKK